jgi:hypothetical protein
MNVLDVGTGPEYPFAAGTYMHLSMTCEHIIGDQSGNFLPGNLFQTLIALETNAQYPFGIHCKRECFHYFPELIPDMFAVNNNKPA